MSYGTIMCGECKQEIHQNGQDHTWYHCVNKTLICQNATKEYMHDGEGVGIFCNKDEFFGGKK